MNVYTKDKIDEHVASCERLLEDKMQNDPAWALFKTTYIRLIDLGFEQQRALRMIACTFSFCVIQKELNPDKEFDVYRKLYIALNVLPYNDAEPYLYGLIESEKNNRAKAN